MRRYPATTILALILLALAACAPERAPEAASTGTEAVDTVGILTRTGELFRRAGVPICTEPQRTGTLPSSLREASGVAASRRHPGVLWTHNDSNSSPHLFAIDSTGQILGRLRVAGARNRDWEDIAIGPCPSGECIYLADTGDNRLERGDAAIYRIPEPAPGDSVTAQAERFPIRYPNGPRDVESLYLLPDGALHLVSKGRRHPIEVFRYPAPLRAEEMVLVREVQQLSAAGVALPYQVTGAGATGDGRWVALRTYSAVHLYRPGSDGLLVPALSAVGLSLRPLAEPQGEGIDIRDDGTIFLVSEAGPVAVPGTMGRLACQIQ
jgi:hypothetical protein